MTELNQRSGGDGDRRDFLRLLPLSMRRAAVSAAPACLLRHRGLSTPGRTPKGLRPKRPPTVGRLPDCCGSHQIRGTAPRSGGADPVRGRLRLERDKAPGRSRPGGRGVAGWAAALRLVGRGMGRGAGTSGGSRTADPDFPIAEYRRRRPGRNESTEKTAIFCCIAFEPACSRGFARSEPRSADWSDGRAG